MHAVLQELCYMYMYMEALYLYTCKYNILVYIHVHCQGFILGDSRGWLLPSLGAHLPSLELLDSTINKGPYLALCYHMGYCLTVPYSAKPKFFHPLSQCLNETLIVHVQYM